MSDIIHVTCPNGHELNAPVRAAGKSLPCPICREMVAVESSRDTLSETAVLRILGDRIAEIASKQPRPPQPAKRDELSDTGVMRILGESSKLPDEPEQRVEAKHRPCPRCAIGVAESLSVCNDCQCYLGPSPDYLRDIAV